MKQNKKTRGFSTTAQHLHLISLSGSSFTFHHHHVRAH